MEQHLVSDTAGWQLVFGGGDDYQILFAAPSDCRQQIMDLAAAQNVQVFRIGSVTQEKRMAVLDEVGQPIDAAPAVHPFLMACFCYETSFFVIKHRRSAGRPAWTSCSGGCEILGVQSSASTMLYPCRR